MSDNNRGSQIKEEDKLDWNKNPQLWVTKLQDTLVGDVNNNDVVRFGIKRKLPSSYTQEQGRPYDAGGNYM